MGKKNLEQALNAEVKRMLGHSESPVKAGRWKFDLPDPSGVYDVYVCEVKPDLCNPKTVSLEFDDGTEWFDRVLTVEEIAGEGVRTHHGRLSLHNLINWAKRVKDGLSYQYFQA